MRWKRFLGRVLATLAVLGLAGGVAGAVLYRKYVVLEPGDHMTEASIRARIAQESLVFYRDGETRIGAFFSDEHREYVSYDRIPQAWVDAITAAEDQRFFEHHGVDWRGFARAMLQNIRAGHFVSGGSTLTMQTSENLFRPGTRDLTGKFWEIVDTYRLEEHYSKEEILEFYANQFHVYGNGRGLGIGARYFFDKDVADLDIQECAFLAGLVKIPARYNPWLGSDEATRQKARDAAQVRVRYVLGRMYADGKITKEQLDTYSERPIPFRKGTFRYDSSILLDEVERELEAAPFPEMFAELGIDNPSTAGIRVITTLDAQTQRAATYGLWHHLSDVGTALEGLAMSGFFQPEERAPQPDPNNPPQLYAMRYAKITGPVDGGVGLDMGSFNGVLDAAAIDRGLGLLAVAVKGDRNAKPSKDLREAFMAALTPGRVVWVSIREKKGETWVCDLEVRPKLQGAVMVMEDGQIRAMVGGNDNRNFNRATEARRQFGSTWKVLVYNAALQLGWAPTDTLDNRRNVFTYSGTWYWPRPDHQSEAFVSMAWAGVRSENLASIWLLYHMLDRLNPEQVRRLAEQVDLAQRSGESRADYVKRVRDDYGVIATKERVEEALFAAVRDEVITDLSFTGHPEDAVEVRSLPYGRGFPDEAARVRKAGGSDRDTRLAILSMNFIELEDFLDRCEAQATLVREATGPLEPARVSLLSVRPSAGGFSLNCGRAPEGWAAVGDSLAMKLGNPELPPVRSDIALHGRIHGSTIKAIRAAIEGRKLRVEGVDPYDPELLYWHPDFRQLLGMRYMAGLAERYGVEREVVPVLSMPLGAVDISLFEAAKLYQGFLRGERWEMPGERFEAGGVPGLRSREDVDAPASGALIIAEIRDRDGNVLYRAKPTAERVADAVAGRLTGDILRNVVVHGTGRRAADAVPNWPLAGKTGTTNDFKNVAFLGYAPIADAHGFQPDRAYTVVAYVGYDDNKPMTRGSLRIAGASGALPTWIYTIQAMQSMGLLGTLPPDQGMAPDGDEYARAEVADLTGLPIGPAGEGAARTVLVLAPAAEPSRRFAPYSDRAQKAVAPQEALPDDLSIHAPIIDAPEGDPATPTTPSERGDTGEIEPRIGTPPSVWDDLEPRARPEPEDLPLED